MVKLWSYSTMTQRALLLVRKKIGEGGSGREGAKPFTQEQDEKSANVCDGLCMCMCGIFMCMQARPRGVSGQWGGVGEGGCSLSAAGGSTGLVEAHGFAQPAGKVHLLHF